MDDIPETEVQHSQRKPHQLTLETQNKNISSSSYSESEEFEESLDSLETPLISPGQQSDTLTYTSNISSRMIDILKKDKRSHEECVFLYKRLKKFEFFTQFKANNPNLHATDALIALCRLLKLEVYGPERILFRAKERNDYKVYLVLSGKINCCKTEDKKPFFKSKTITFDDDSTIDATPRSTVDTKTIFRRDRPTKTMLLTQSKFKFLESKSRMNDFESVVEEPSVYDGLRIYDCIKKGESVCAKNLDNPPDKRDFTAITGTLCELLSFKLEDYHSLITRFEKSNTQLQNFLFDHIPELEKSIRRGLLQNLENFFWEETFQLYHNITSENGKGKVLYILYEGKCEILKDHESKSILASERSVVPQTSRICIIEPGVLIGEEILFNKTNTYEYTVKVISSEARVLAIDKHIFKTKLPYSVQMGVQALFLSKNKQNLNIQNKKLETIASMPNIQQALSPTLKNLKLPLNTLQSSKLSSNLLKHSVSNKNIHSKENSPYGLSSAKQVAIKQFSRKNIDFTQDKDVLRTSPGKVLTPKPYMKLEKHFNTKSTQDFAKIEDFKFDFGKTYQTKILKPLAIKDPNLTVRAREGLENEKSLSRLASYLSPHRKSQLNFRVLDVNQSNMKSAETTNWNDSSMVPISVSKLRMSFANLSETSEPTPVASARPKEGIYITSDAFMTCWQENESSSQLPTFNSAKKPTKPLGSKKNKLLPVSTHRRTKTENLKPGLGKPCLDGLSIGNKSPTLSIGADDYHMETRYKW